MNEKIPGGLAKGMSLADIAKHHKMPLKSIKLKLDQGTKHEMEHTTDRSIAREIAIDHIYEDPNYYSKLKKLETEGTCGYDTDVATGTKLKTPGGLEEGDPKTSDKNNEGLYDDQGEGAGYNLVKQNPFNIQKLVDKGIIFVGLPGDGEGGIGKHTFPGDSSILTLFNMLNKPDPWMVISAKNPRPTDIPYVQKGQYRLFYNGKYNQILWGIDKKGLNPKDFYLQEDGQKTSDKNMDDYKKQNNPSGKVKDPFGLNQFARELVMGLEEADPKTGTGKKPKGSSRRLYTDEDPSDTVGIKFSTKQDIIDTLSKTSFKSKSHARQSQIINLIHQRVRAAYERAKDPDVKRRLKTALDYAEQRKEASKDKTQRLKQLKEVEGSAIPYGSGYKKYIPEITKFMLDKGMNIKPLPVVKFIEDDEENAKNILGRTAFYNPNEKSISLFTLGRHPKDILRSFCHEMIHHMQNIEDRLPAFSTTNTQEDSTLNDIEEEAHKLGSMLMREFEDTIKK